jgi:predicted metal-dependent phosphoesterase TrpH
MRLWKYDLHCHARPTRNGESAHENFIAAAIAAGMDGLAFTEHSHTEQPLTEQQCAALSTPSFGVFCGQEVSEKIFGDVLVYGEFAAISRDMKLKDIRRLGAVIARAHPYRTGKMLDAKYWPLFDAVEAENGNHKRDNHLKMRAEYTQSPHYVIIGGSDAHRASHVGRAYTVCPYQLKTTANLLRAIRAGHVLPVCEYE